MTLLKATEAPLSQTYSLALLDLDGVVYRGKDPVAFASESIRQAEHLGMTIEYTTNNSSRMQSAVADQLRGFGLDVEPGRSSLRRSLLHAWCSSMYLRVPKCWWWARNTCRTRWAKPA